MIQSFWSKSWYPTLGVGVLYCIIPPLKTQAIKFPHIVTYVDLSMKSCVKSLQNSYRFFWAPNPYIEDTSKKTGLIGRRSYILEWLLFWKNYSFWFKNSELLYNVLVLLSKIELKFIATCNFQKSQKVKFECLLQLCLFRSKIEYFSPS